MERQHSTLTDHNNTAHRACTGENGRCSVAVHVVGAVLLHTCSFVSSSTCLMRLLLVADSVAYTGCAPISSCHRTALLFCCCSCSRSSASMATLARLLDSSTPTTSHRFGYCKKACMHSRPQPMPRSNTTRALAASKWSSSSILLTPAGNTSPNRYEHAARSAS